MTIGHSVRVVEGEAQYVTPLHELTALGSPGADATTWNRRVRSLEAAFSRLRQTPEGRSAVERQLGHPDATARTWVASHVAMWNRAIAQPVLEEVAQHPGTVGFNAEQTLRSLEAEPPSA